MYKAVYELLHGVVDYAGLFPPAALPLDRVVANYSEYLASEESWMLGRLIAPLRDLEALTDQARSVPRSANAWRISCLLPSAESQQLRADVQALLQFNDDHSSNEVQPMFVDAVEVKANSTEDIEAIARALPPHIETFIELPLTDADTNALVKCIAEQAADHLRAKMRTGGVYEALIPPPEFVTKFIRSCAKHQIPFKATAGLHHPVRAEQRLTYERNSNRAVMHGFLNVLLATAVLYANQNSTIGEQVMIEEGAANFVPSDAGWLWNQRELTLEQIQFARQNGMRSFGSCSFVEPVEDLEALGIDLTGVEPTVG